MKAPKAAMEVVEAMEDITPMSLVSLTLRMTFDKGTQEETLDQLEMLQRTSK